MWVGDFEALNDKLNDINLPPSTQNTKDYYVDRLNAVSTSKEIEELKERIKTLEKLVDKLIAEFMPELKI